MVQRKWFVIYYLVYFMGTVIVTGVTVLAQVLIPVVT
jgi:hypothetical protein